MVCMQSLHKYPLWGLAVVNLPLLRVSRAHHTPRLLFWNQFCNGGRGRGIMVMSLFPTPKSINGLIIVFKTIVVLTWSHMKVLNSSIIGGGRFLSKDSEGWAFWKRNSVCSSHDNMQLGQHFLGNNLVRIVSLYSNYNNGSPVLHPPHL